MYELHVIGASVCTCQALPQKVPRDPDADGLSHAFHPWTSNAGVPAEHPDNTQHCGGTFDRGRSAV